MVCRRRSHKTAIISADPPFEDDTTSTDFQSLAIDSRTHLFHQLTFSSGQAANFIVDTGSPISFMPYDEFKKVANSIQMESSIQTIKGVSGHNLPVKGEVSLQVTDKNSNKPLPLTFVITEKGPNILGLDGLRTLRVNVVLEVQTPMPPAITSLIHKCSKNSRGISVTPVKLEVDCEPIFKKARPVPYGLRPAVEENIKNLTKQMEDLVSAETSGLQSTLSSNKVRIQPKKLRTCSKDSMEPPCFRKLI